MTNDQRQTPVRFLVRLLIIGVVVFLPGAGRVVAFRDGPRPDRFSETCQVWERVGPWQVYAFREGSFVLLPASSVLQPIRSPNPLTAASSVPKPLAPLSPCPPVSLSPGLSSLPPSWHVTDAALADVTGDGDPEWVLLVWRPWRDWPIQRWTSTPSPVAGFHDAAGDSCQLILLDPGDGREIWAGSALPVPMLALEVGDVDGDGRNEIVTLEGDYAAGRHGSATYVDVWRWNGFGFTLAWRSAPGAFRQLGLTDMGNGGILKIAVR